MTPTPEPPADARDRAFMRRALALARRGWGQTAPNPMVGAVIVRDGVVVGEGSHARFGEAHAEVVALAAAGGLARGATMYVTLEPCAHHGKTPPCAPAIVAAGVSRVVVAVPDPDPVAAGGLHRLRAAGIATTVGVETDAALELDAAFFHRFASRRPWVTLKLALSIDGAMADARGHSRWITGRRARTQVHVLRAGSDAIAVGVGTVLADDPALTVRHAPAPRVPPRRVIFDRTARTPVTAAVVRTAGEIPTVIVAEDPDAARARALEDAGVQVVCADSLVSGLETLALAGVHALFVEGGGRLAGALWADSLVDRLIIFQGPVVLGGGAQGVFSWAPSQQIETAPRLRVVERRAMGDDAMTVFAVHDVPMPDAGRSEPHD